MSYRFLIVERKLNSWWTRLKVCSFRYFCLGKNNRKFDSAVIFWKWWSKSLFFVFFYYLCFRRTASRGRAGNSGGRCGCRISDSNWSWLALSLHSYSSFGWEPAEGSSANGSDWSFGWWLAKVRIWSIHLSVWYSECCYYVVHVMSIN